MKTKFKNVDVIDDATPVLIKGVTLEVEKKGLRQSTKRPKSELLTPWSLIYFPERAENTVSLTFVGRPIQTFYTLKSRGDAKDLYKGITKYLSKDKR